ncbi:anti-sigma-F factor Fin [Salimicrobium halophilum]|uniref:Anti-sigma-F factor Fin n=1 Tax=Salimicrobium halophilum TaxID=86666 RepID=A0A1G8W266_9BACI|nr:anti-sigma-F factor Fin [Salimicrobium halophilum]SDJ72461.1 Protein of unknown function [Salimicrobium halophilum]
MHIHYTCRHCDRDLATIQGDQVPLSKLGFDVLDAEDIERMVDVQNNGDVVLHVVCDECQDMQQNYLHYRDPYYFIQ